MPISSDCYLGLLYVIMDWCIEGLLFHRYRKNIYIVLIVLHISSSLREIPRLVMFMLSNNNIFFDLNNSLDFVQS